MFLIRIALEETQEAHARTEVARRCSDVAWVSGSVLRARSLASARRAAAVLNGLGAGTEIGFSPRGELPETD